MIKLIKNKKTNKYRLVNTEKIINNDENNRIFTDNFIKFSYTYDINNIGKFNSEKGMVNLLLDDNGKCNYIPKIDVEITEGVFHFIKCELEIIINNYGNIIEYKVIYEDGNNTMKEDVLKIEFEKVFDRWGMRIVYQDFNVLKRGIFTDNDIKVSSNYIVEYDRINDWLYILGKNSDKDDNIIFVTNEEKEIIENKVKLINEKYNIEKRWRADEGGKYYSIYHSTLNIDSSYEHNNELDNKRYEIGNYFKTKELAKNKLKEIKKLLLK